MATTRKLRKSPVFQFLFLAVNHFVLMAILNIIIYSIKHLQGMSILNAISIVYIAGEYDGPPFCTPIGSSSELIHTYIIKKPIKNFNPLDMNLQIVLI